MSNENNFVTNDIVVKVTPAQKRLLDLINPTEVATFHTSLKTVHYLGTYNVPIDIADSRASYHTHLLIDALQELTQENTINRIKTELL